jgi:NhaA family Na+:H+ antiporter
LVIGKPLGISLVALLAPKLRLARGLDDVTFRALIGAACLCGVGDTVALLMADQALAQDGMAAIAKTGVLIGSVIAAALGATIIALEPPTNRKSPMSPSRSVRPA